MSFQQQLGETRTPRKTAAFLLLATSQIDPLYDGRKRRLAEKKSHIPTNAIPHRTPARRELPLCIRRATTSRTNKARQAPATNPIDSSATNSIERLPLHPSDLHPLEHLGIWEHHRDSSETCRSPARIFSPHPQPKGSLERHLDLILDRPPMN